MGKKVVMIFLKIDWTSFILFFYIMGKVVMNSF